MPGLLDALIIGGGPAGAAAAWRLARAGHSVVLFERETRPRPRVCGEFLSGAARAELVDLGIDVGALGAIEIARMRVVHRHARARAALPSAGCGLSRELLDEHLLGRAGEAGAEVRRGATVRRLERVDGRWRVVLADGSCAEAAAALLATGKHDLRGHRRPARTSGDPVGLKMHCRLAPGEANAIANQIELVWFDGGYAGLQPVEGGVANLCLVLDAARCRRLGKAWEHMLAKLQELAPHLRARLSGARPAAAAPAAVAGIPYGYVHARNADRPDLYRIGDQFAVIPSFTGEGVALALRTARLAAAALTAKAAPSAYHATARDEVARTVDRACRIARAARHPLAQTLLVRASGLMPGVLPALARHARMPPDIARRQQRAQVRPP